ncbi:MAG: tetratricopeptide repeat protein [Candidatus Eisenbacteria bacterium]
MSHHPEADDPLPGETDLALRLAREGRCRHAVDLLSKVLELESEPAERRRIAATLAQVARISEDRLDLDAAIAALDLASTLVEWADLHSHHGRLLAQMGRRADARRALDRALALNPHYRAAAVERALLDAREGRIAEAMETLRILASDRELTEPRAFEQGLEYLGHADFEDAGALLRRALHASDAWLEHRLHAFQELSDRGEHGAAVKTLREAVTERPNYPDLHLLLGLHELRFGSVDDAVDSLAHALELNPQYHAARVAFARALEATGDTHQALLQLRLVLGLEARHREARALHDRLAGRRRGVRTTA